ncbi:MAG TPA: methyl-accepting chemotaxis protein, partial [Roseiflexaceae bacterium]|nr:methyl-accepting chemotaxis protein [Roseiflexaceae bacterium]
MERSARERTSRERLTDMISSLQGSAGERAQLLVHLAVAFAGVAVAGSALVIVLALASILPVALIGSALLVIVMVLVIAGATLATVRMRYYDIATSIFLYGSQLYVAALIFLTDGVTGPAFIAFLFPILAAGLFGRASDSFWLFLIALGIYSAFAVGEISGAITPLNSGLGEVTRSVTFVIFFGAVGALLAYLALLWSASTERFIAQSHQQSEEVFQYNQQLMEKNIQQVELGSELAGSSADLLASAHEQASGATEQASAVAQVSTTIEELGSTARQIAIAAEQVAEAARQTLENLSDGQDAVDKSIQAMDRIRSRMQDVSSRVLNLGERSQQIGEIIDLIDDISDETHLLALNAAIEAAGAGEHGRRFAVVAAEVKSLANRALAAAREVKGAIAEIQQATTAAVLAAEEGGKEVARGVDLAHSAGQVMDSIVMVAERTAQSGAEISLATAQQQSASEQVVETMREIADVARRTAIGARQV